MMNKSINNQSDKNSNKNPFGAKGSGAGFAKSSQIEETKSEGFVEGVDNEDEEELKQMSKSTVWT